MNSMEEVFLMVISPTMFWKLYIKETSLIIKAKENHDDRFMNSYIMELHSESQYKSEATAI